MPSPTNDLFKFVALRQPSEDYSIDPSEIVSGSIALELLQGSQVNITNPQPEVLARLESVPILSDSQLNRMKLDEVTDFIYSDEASNFEGLRQGKVRVENNQIPLTTFTSMSVFREEYRKVFDSW